MLSAIIVGAGSSRRVGFDKLTVPIAGGTVIGYTIAAFQNCQAVDEFVLVVRPDRVAEFRVLLEGRFGKLKNIVAGGMHRQDSVRAGLASISADEAFVAVHDAARPLVTPGVIEEVFAAARETGAASAAAPVADTLKRADGNCFVDRGVDREGLFAMQTPQIFARSLLVSAYEKVVAEGIRITDDVSAVEGLGAPVRLVPNPLPNFKITYESDLRLAELVLSRR